MNAKAVVFDFNGTLYFDFFENQEAWELTGKHFLGGKAVPPFNTYAGMTDSACSRIINPEASEEEILQMIEYKENTYKAICINKGLTLERDAVSFIRKLNSDGIITAIGSSAPVMNFAWYIPEYNLKSLFKTENMFYGRENLKSKPAADLYNLVLDSIGIKAEDAICFEDAVNGIKAALGAGFKKVYAIKSPGINWEETKKLAPLLSWKEVLDDYSAVIDLTS